MIPFGSDSNPQGPMSSYGVRPGKAAFQYDGPLWRQDLHMLFYTTTHEAITKVLPSPLEPNHDLPPICMAACWITDMRLADGRKHNYVGASLNPACRYKDTTGQYCSFEYIDGVNGDKTAGAEIILLVGQAFGCNKKLGNVTIHAYGDAHHISCERRGQRILDARYGNFTPASDMQGFFEDNPHIGAFLMAGRSLGVREVPKTDHSGYDIRSVVGMGHAMGGDVREFSIGEGSLDLRGSETDPVNILEVVEYGPAIRIEQYKGKEIWTEAEEIERLPTE
jgi:hypothetical protein